MIGQKNQVGSKGWHGALSRWLYRISAGMRCRTIEINGQPYLERYLVGRAFGVTVYLHRFLTADGERHLHDHPWRFSVGIPLVGGYVEERLDHLDARTGPVSVYRRTRRFWPNVLTTRTFHRIHSVQWGTWTLFAHSPYFRVWGFLRREPPLDLIAGHPPAVRITYEQPLDVAADGYQTGADPWADRPLGAELRMREAA